MTNGVSNAPPPKGPSAQGQSARNPHERAVAADRFKASLGNARPAAKPSANGRSGPSKAPRAEKSEEPSPFEVRADGLLVVAPYAFSPAIAGSGAHAIHGKVQRAQAAARATELAEQAQRDVELGVENVRVGRAGETVRVHATVSRGEHQGVELRAVSKDGRVEVELRATDHEAAQRLRAEMGSLRSSLDSQGIDRVNVNVVDASSEGRGASGEHSNEGRQQEQRERQRASHSQDEPLSAGRASRGASRGEASDQRDESDPRDPRELREIQDDRDYLL